MFFGLLHASYPCNGALGACRTIRSGCGRLPHWTNFRFINDFHRSIHPCTDTKGHLVWCGGEQLRPRDG